jgi:D-methionine transport system substrate-binding protein
MISLSFLCRRRLCLIVGAVVMGAAAAGPPPPQQPLRIGVIASVANEATEQAIAEAAVEGLKVELVEFSDWVMPNTAVQEGAVDANFFQHAPFLERFNRARGTQLTPIAYGYSTTMGLFSKKLKRGEPIAAGALIGIPSDPVNMGRALLLLQSMQLITLDAGVTHQAALTDVVDNPHKLKFIQIEGSQAARSFDDVTASVTYTTFAKHGGLNEKDGLAFDNCTPENVKRYAIRWVTLPERAQDPRLLRFIAIYQRSSKVQATLKRLYGDLIDFPWQ